MNRTCCTTVLALVATLAAAPAQAQQGMRIDDLARTRSVGQIALAPDGAAVAHTVAVPRDVLAGVGTPT